MTDLDMN